MFVEGTGDRANGMVTNTDPDYPLGFRDNQGIEPEPRLGIAYDLTGDNKTGLHASVGCTTTPTSTRTAWTRWRGTAGAEHAEHHLRDHGYAAGGRRAGAFANRPSNVFGIERDAKTPVSYNYSVGVQRELGWGTVLDVTYAGFQMRNGEMEAEHQSVPDGARYLDVNPQNADPRTPTAAKPAEFLRPYLGYQNITMRSHFGEASYNSLQLQLNRRYINGLQFAIAYTLGKTVSDGTVVQRAPTAGPRGTWGRTARRSSTIWS